MKSIRQWIWVLLSFFFILPTQVYAGGFEQGSKNISVLLGSGQSFNENYIILGAGFGYYVVNGLELGVDAQYWFSGSPSIAKISPQITYVLPLKAKIKPYVGVFYRRTFVNASSIPNQNSYGYRGGVYFSSRSGVHLGGGLVYEKYPDCHIGECSNTYPELLISIGF